ncbi:MAG: hypothetical protein AB1705_27035 [Verrucomicrobiota bacterium]
MAAETPTIEPALITAGSTATWKRSLSDYKASDGWTLKYRLRKSTSTNLSITSTASGDDHLISVSAATTAGWTTGKYAWYAFVESGSQRFDVGEGFLEVRADPATSSSFDGRTHARKMLDAIESMLEGNASREEQALTITSGGVNRQIQFCTKEELLKFRAYYSNEVRAEEQALARQQGRATGNRILTRFKKAS